MTMSRIAAAAATFSLGESIPVRHTATTLTRENASGESSGSFVTPIHLQ